MVTTVLYQKNGFEQLELNKFVVFVSRKGLQKNKEK